MHYARIAEMMKQRLAGATGLLLMGLMCGGISQAQLPGPVLIPNVVTTVGGNAQATTVFGYNGDGRAATSATLYNPGNVAVDPAGNIYFADTGSNIIREINGQTGIISTVAGIAPAVGCTGNSGSTTTNTCYGAGTAITGDGGLATSAKLILLQGSTSGTQGLAVDALGNLFLGDNTTGVQVVYKAGAQLAKMIALLDPTGVATSGGVKSGYIYLIAGAATGTGSPSVGPQSPTVARFSAVFGIALDPSGNLYIQDQNHNVRVVNMQPVAITVFGVSVPVGQINEVVGGACCATTATLGGLNGLPSTTLMVNNNRGLYVDASGNVYSTSINGGTQGVDLIYSGGAGNIATNLIAKLNPTLTPTANTQYILYGMGTGKTATGFNYPSNSYNTGWVTSATADGVGNVYVAEFNNNQLTRIDAVTGSVTTIGGRSGAHTGATPSNPLYCTGTTGLQTTDLVGDGCTQALTQMSAEGVSIDAAGNLYAADRGYNLIRKILIGSQFPSSSVGTAALPQTLRMKFYSNNLSAATTPFKIAGSSSEFSINVTTPPVCTLNTPGDLTQDCIITVGFTPTGPGARTGQLLATDAAGVVHPFALTGTGRAPSIAIDSPLATTLASGLYAPGGVAVDALGNTYIADTNNNRILQMPAGGTTPISVVSSTLSIGGSTLKVPQGVAVDAAGNLYIADTGNSRVLRLAAGTTTPAVLVGNFNKPAGVATDTVGNVYVADTGNAQVILLPAPATIGAIAPTALVTGSITLSKPVGVTVDPAGNVYIVDAGLNQVIAISPSDLSAAAKPVASIGTFTSVGGVVADAAGTVYFTDSSKNTLNAIPAGTSLPVVLPLSGLTNPAGLALDTSGNLYVADAGNNRVVFLNRSQATLSYNAVNLGMTSVAQNITVSNIGNSTPTPPLALSGLSVSPAYQQPQTATNACGATTSLTPGAECTLSIAYSPTAAANGNGALVLTDNTLGGTAVVQTIPLLSVGNTAQTITFGALPNVTYGVVPIMLTASTSSPLPIIYVITGPATLSGATLKITGAGTVSITATQPGSGGGYAAATPVTQTFTVAPTVLTVTADGIGLGLYQAVPGYTATYSGFVNGDTQATVLTGQPYLTTNPTTPSAAGNYVITTAVGSLVSNANYTLTLVNGLLQIAINSQTITFPMLNKGTGTAIYGASLIPLTASASATPSAIYPVTYTSSNPGVATVVPSSTGYSLQVTGVGSAQVTAIQVGDGKNYPRVSTVQALTVGQATLTVTAASQSVYYGQAVPAYTYGITGLVNNDSATVVTGAPALTTAPAVASAVGNYTITLTQGTLAAANYSFNVVSGSLTIAPAPLTLTIGNGTSIYGAPLPASYSTSATGLVGTDSLTTTLTVTFVYSPTAVPGSVIGSYSAGATLGGPSAANYAVTVVPGTLNITTLAVSAIASGTTFPYGSVVPPISGVLSNLLPQDSGKVVPLFTTTATSTSPLGSYPITGVTLTGSAAGNYTVQMAGAASITVSQAGSVTVVAAVTGAPGTTANLPVTLTAAVSSSTSGAPTGNVSFFDGGSLIGTTSAPLVAGIATLSTTDFAVGTTHYITATYNGDVNFTSSTSIVLPETPAIPAYTVTAPPSLTIQRGTIGSVTLVISPQGGYTGTITLGCTGLPELATCKFSTTAITLTGSTTAAQVATLSITTLGPPSYSMLLRPSVGRGAGEPRLASLFFLPAGLLALCAGLGRRRLNGRLGQVLLLVMLAAGLAGASGCGGTQTYTPTGTYNVTVTAIGTPTADSGIPASTVNSSITLTITN